MKKICKCLLVLLSGVGLSSCGNSIDGCYFDVTFTPTISSSSTEYYWTDEEEETTTNDLGTSKKTTVNIKSTKNEFVITTKTTYKSKYTGYSLSKVLYDSVTGDEINYVLVENNLNAEVKEVKSYKQDQISSLSYGKGVVETSYVETTYEDISYKKEVDATTYKNLKNADGVYSYSATYYCTMESYKDYLVSVDNDSPTLVYSSKYYLNYFNTGYDKNNTTPKEIEAVKTKKVTTNYIKFTIEDN